MTGACDAFESDSTVPVASTLFARGRGSWPATSRESSINSSIRGPLPLDDVSRDLFALSAMSDGRRDPSTSGTETRVTSTAATSEGHTRISTLLIGRPTAAFCVATSDWPVASVVETVVNLSESG